MNVRTSRQGLTALRVALSIAIIASVTSVGLCGTSNAAPQSGREDASFRVAHASPDAPAVSVLVDGDPLIREVSFGIVTGYRTIAPGTRTIEVATAGQDGRTLFMGDLEIDAGRN